jgi:hypothetical protein
MRWYHCEYAVADLAILSKRQSKYGIVDLQLGHHTSESQMQQKTILSKATKATKNNIPRITPTHHVCRSNDVRISNLVHDRQLLQFVLSDRENIGYTLQH